MKLFNKFIEMLMFLFVFACTVILVNAIIFCPTFSPAISIVLGVIVIIGWYLHTAD